MDAVKVDNPEIETVPRESNNTRDTANRGNRTRDRDDSRPRRNRTRSRSRSRSRERTFNNIKTKRVYVSNIPYEYRWQEVKDLFRNQVGEVTFVELFMDEDKKPRGCGIIEFATIEQTKKALINMHRFEVQGRRLVVKEDYDTARDDCGRIMRSGGGGGGQDGGGPTRGGPSGGGGGRNNDDRRRWSSPPPMRGGGGGRMGGGGGGGGGRLGNTFGLSADFLESLGIDGPLQTKVFIANLDFIVDEKKLREVFRLAGRVFDAEISRDKDGKSRGFGIVEFEHPVEAVQAISMLNNQMLYDRRMTVRLDRADPAGSNKLPEGLRSLGMGLGTNGKPLVDVARNLPNNQGILNLEAAIPAAVTASLSRLGTTAAIQQALNPGLNSAALGLSGLGSGLGSGFSALAGGNDYGAGAASGGLGAEALLRSAAASLPLQNAMNAAAVNNANVGRAGGMGLGVGQSPFGVNVSQNSQFNRPDSRYLSSTASMGADRSPFARDSFSSNQSSNMPAGMGNTSNYSNPAGNSLDSAATANPVYQTNLARGVGGGVGGDYRDGGYANGATGGADNTQQRRGGQHHRDTVLVNNLAADCTWQMLKDKFSAVGDVRFTEMIGRGTGLVRFNVEADAERAIRLLDRTRFNGSIIELRIY